MDEHKLWILHPVQSERVPQSADPDNTMAYRLKDNFLQDGAKADVWNM